jgi:hypothetical protein
MWKYHKETPCAAAFIANKLNCHVFRVTCSLFFFYKIREQEGRTIPAQGAVLEPVRGECVGEKG